MVVYDTIEQIPYSELKNGGTFQVYYVPNEMAAVGYGMAVIPAGDYANDVLLNSYGASDDDPRFPAILVTFISLTLYTVCAVVVLKYLTGFVATIKAIPEGQTTEILPNGDRIHQTADGTTWLLRADGTTKKLSDAPADFSSTIYAAVGLVLVITIAYIAIKFWPSSNKEKKGEKNISAG